MTSGCTIHQKWVLRSPLAPTRFAVLRGMAEKAVSWRVIRHGLNMLLGYSGFVRKYAGSG